MWNRGFKGWYFKHQLADDTIAFIPGRAEGGAFIQMIDAGGSRQFHIKELAVKNQIIRADKCTFSTKGIHINLPGVYGKIKYRQITPLQSDIMGPFRFFPMECRHGVISMSHYLTGYLIIDGKKRNYTSGKGYIESDRGISFPKAYMWIHCNDFNSTCSLMLSVATIPFAGFHFKGCICALIYMGNEYRFATYHGVKILKCGPQHVSLVQGKMRLEIGIRSYGQGHPLFSPNKGLMSGIIRESHQAKIKFSFYICDCLICTDSSKHASFECENM